MANSNITKKALAQSLKELGSTKILDKITVADITNHFTIILMTSMNY